MAIYDEMSGVKEEISFILCGLFLKSLLRISGVPTLITLQSAGGKCMPGNCFQQ